MHNTAPKPVHSDLRTSCSGRTGTEDLVAVVERVRARTEAEAIFVGVAAETGVVLEVAEKAEVVQKVQVHTD